MKPIEADTFKKICKLQRDNVEWRDFWMMLDEGRICIAKQKPGYERTEHITIPKKTFDRFIKWYQTGQWPVKL